MDQSKGLSALGYLSFYFAPFILPLIIFFVTKDQFVKDHCKKAFITQFIPIVLCILYIIYFISLAISWNEAPVIENFFASTFFIGFVIFLVITLVIGLWNLFQAIKVLR